MRLKFFKKRILILLALAHIIPHVASECNEGTLRCSSSNSSEVCDFTTSYILDAASATCKLEVVEGCQFAALDQKTRPCTLCEAGKVFNVEKTKCSPLGFTDRIDKCLNYEPKDRSCLVCQEDYYLNMETGKCTSVGNSKINGCQVYTGVGICRSCKDGLYLKESKCIEAPKVENCLVSTFYLCQSCQNGYELVSGRVEKPIFDENFLRSISATISGRATVSIEGDQRPICVKKNILHCQEYESFNGCKSCTTDYFVNSNKQCERNPEKQIPNCEKYESAEKCILCKEKFYLTGNPTECKAITEVAKCSEYSKTEDKCLKCEDPNFLNVSENKCPDRTRNSIADCKTYSPTTDSCLACVEGYTATTPGAHKCLVNPEICVVGKVILSADDGEKHTCSQCPDKTYYLANGVCSKGDISECLEFVSDKNECAKCKQNFNKASASSCLAAQKENCLGYSENTDNCINCEKGYFVKDNGCTKQTKENCNIHSTNSDNCSTCQPGFFADVDGSCKRQELARCKTHVANKNECEECSLGYHPDGQTKCIVNTLENCKLFKVNTNECVICSKGYFAKVGACEAQSLPGCVDYNDNFNSCKFCQAGMYYDGSACRAVSHAGCIKWEANRNTCLECSISHYKHLGANTVSTCTARDKTHCTLYTPDTNLCIRCSRGYYAKDGSCERGTQEKCNTLKDQEDKCSSCVQGYYPDINGVCQTVTTVTNCQVYKTTEDKCEDCGTGKFTADGSKCEVKNVTHCAQYSTSKSNAECVKCEPTLKKKLGSSGTSCDPLTNDANCYSSAGNADDKCDACVPGKYLVGGQCTGAGDSSLFDTNCVSHSNEDNSTTCSKCAANFIAVGGVLKPAIAQAALDTANCLKINNSGQCIQCKDNFYLQGSTCNAYSGNQSDQMCVRKVSEATSSLDNGSDCEKCIFESLYYINSGNKTCTTRGPNSNSLGCSQYDSSSASCLSCREGFYPGTQSYQISCETTTTLNPSNTIQNCQVFAAPSDCYACDQGFKTAGSAGSRTCTAVDAKNSVSRAYDAQLNPASSLEISEVNNCKTYAQINGTTLGCIKCKDNFVGIVKYDTANTVFNHEIAYSDSGSHAGIEDEVNVYSKCADGNLWYMHYSNHSQTNSNYCEVGYQISPDTTGYACLKCRQGRRGRLASVDVDKTMATNFGSQFFALYTCDAYNLAKRFYKFMSSSTPNIPKALRYSTHFRYDSCVDNSNDVTRSSTLALVYMYVLDKDKGHLTRSIREDTDSSTSLLEFYCLPKTRVESISNCAFFMLGQDLSGDINTTTFDFSTLAICGACLPGFKPSFENGKVNITSCGTISDITTTANVNSWLNSGQTPSNSGWKFDPGLDPPMIDFSTPLTAEQSRDNCIAADISGGNSAIECVLCKEGFEPHKGTCVPTIAIGDDCQYKMGRLNHKMLTTPAEKVSIQFANMVRLRHAISDANYTAQTTEACKSCKTSKSPRFDASKNLAICTKESAAPAQTVSDCEQVSVSDKTKCVKCKPNFALKVDDKTCVSAVGNLANCIGLDPFSSCNHCADGYAFLPNGTCNKHYCKEFDPMSPVNCNVCEDNKALVGNEVGYCSSTDHTDSECINMSPSFGHCVKSKTPGKIPYVIRVKTDFIVVQTIVDHVSYSLSGNGYNNINNEYVFIEAEYSNNTKVTTAKLVSLETVSHRTREFDNSNTVDPSATHCAPFRLNMTDCITNPGLYCTSCNFGFGLAIDGKCVSTPLPKCKLLLPIPLGFVCTQCEDNYILTSGPESCETLRVNSLGNKCLTWNATEDKCATCPSGKYLTAAGMCEPNTAVNCEVLSTTALECTTCSNKYHVNNATPGACQPHKAVNCDTYTNKADTCIKCAFGYAKNASNICEPIPINTCKTWDNTNKICETCSPQMSLNIAPPPHSDHCLPKTKNSCLAFSETKDECTSCRPGFVLNSGACETNTAKNCGDFKADKHECETCIPNTRITSGTTCGLRVAEMCKSFVTTAADECDACVESSYKNSSKQCVRPTDSHCMTVKPTENKCELCQGGWIVNDSGACIENAFEGCLIQAPGIEKCESCPVSKYLNLEKKCLDNDAIGCNERSTTVNECINCQDGHWLDTLAGNRCRENSALNCLVKSKAKGECLSCIAGVYKRVTGSGSIDCLKYAAKNCKEYQSDKDECSKCLPEFYMKTDLGGEKTCSARTITKCSQFETEKDQCTVCLNKQFMVDLKCVDSTLVTNCDQYSKTENKCLSCVDGYYKPSFADECWHYPDGIDNCQNYSSRTQCIRCKPGFFLANDAKCESVTGNVPGCVIYSSATDCQTCESGKWPKTGSCVPTTAANCKEYIDEATCKLCSSSYGKNPANNKCESLGIDLCIEGLFSESGNTCSRCLVGSLLSIDKKSCESADVNVENCHSYESKQKCGECKPGFLLSTDGLKCTAINNLAGKNCATGKALEVPACDLCKLGYVLENDGSCSKISIENCYLPNIGQSSCEICMPGTHMDKSGKCIKTDKTTPGFDPIRSAIFSIFLFLLILDRNV